MLTWFPSPYPDELFYSVLCRYYVSSGVKEHYLVKKQLFGTKAGVKMATLYPNATVHAALLQLPDGVFDERDMILRHTPFLYYARMRKKSAKSCWMTWCRGEAERLPTSGKHFPRTITPSGIAHRVCRRTHRYTGSRTTTSSTRYHSPVYVSGTNAG